MHSTLYIFVTSDVDPERCSAHMNGDEAGGVEWRHRNAYRLNLSHETLLEEVAYAGIQVSDFQTLMFSTSVVRSPLLDRLCEDAKLTVCGSLSEDARERLRYCSHADLLEDHIIDPRASPAALRAFGNNLVSSFQRGCDSGFDGAMEPVSPLLERLREGAVAIEIHQGGGGEARERAVADTVTLLKSVAQQQGIETFICCRPHAENDYDADVPPGHELMNIGVFSSHFADAFFDDITSTTCLAKHLQASVGTQESSFSSLQLTAATTSNFVTCDSPEEQVVFLKVAPGECSVFYRHFDASTREDARLRFRLAETEDVETELRAQLARNCYSVVGGPARELDAERAAPPPDMHSHVGRMMQRITGPRVLGVATHGEATSPTEEPEGTLPPNPAMTSACHPGPAGGGMRRGQGFIGMPPDGPAEALVHSPKGFVAAGRGGDLVHSPKGFVAAGRGGDNEALLAHDTVRQAQESVLEMASRMEETRVLGDRVESELRRELASVLDENALLKAQVQVLTVSLEDSESKAKVLLDQVHRSNQAVPQEGPPEENAMRAEDNGTPESASPLLRAPHERATTTRESEEKGRCASSAVLLELARKHPNPAGGAAPKHGRERKHAAGRAASYPRSKDDARALRAMIIKK